MAQTKGKKAGKKARRTKDLAPRSASKVKAGFVPGAGILSNAISAKKQG